jgi:predicted nucleotidyltransferase
MFAQMRDHPLLKELFASTSHQRVLSVLAERPGVALYVREISSLAGVSAGGASEVLADLAALNLVARQQRGKLTLYTADVAAPLIRYFKILLNLADLQLLLDKLKLIAREVILFGSRAEGTDTTESDIDLFVIAADKTAIYETVQQSTLAEKTRPVVITPIESVELKQQDPLFYEQVMRGILLWKGLSQDES